METFRNLPDFYKTAPPLFRKKYVFIPLSLPAFSLFSKIVVKTLHIMVDTMVDEIKNKETKQNSHSN